MNENQLSWQSSWTVHEEIARGGQGVVTELRSKSDPSKRAVLKEILPRWKNDAQAKQRLEQEADILKKLHDLGARVPAVYESFAGSETDDPFVLMEFIPGLRFDKWLTTTAPVKPQEGVLITRAIHIQNFNVTRAHYKTAAIAAIAAYGVGMDIHFYAAGYTSPANEHQKCEKALLWTKIAVVDQSEDIVSDRTLSVIATTIKSKLAHEIRGLSRPGIAKRLSDPSVANPNAT